MSPAPSTKEKSSSGITFDRVIAIIITAIILWSGNSLHNNSVELKETRVSLAALTDKVKDFQDVFEKRIDGFASKSDVAGQNARIDRIEDRVHALEKQK